MPEAEEDYPTSRPVPQFWRDLQRSVDAAAHERRQHETRLLLAVLAVVLFIGVPCGVIVVIMSLAQAAP